MAKQFSWRRAVSRHLFVYAFDMAVAIAGWTYGFGLHVVNWTALLLLLFLSRFVFATLTVAWLHRAAAEYSVSGIDEVFIDALADRLADKLIDSVNDRAPDASGRTPEETDDKEREWEEGNT